MSASPLAAILDHVRAEPSRTWSIIISFFGDAIVPRGGSVWLGTLLAFFKGMDVGETVVRSAVSRLSSENWLTRSRQGRHSFYHLAARGQDEFAQATQRIYHHQPQQADGAFEAVLAEPSAREALEQAGFGMVLPGLFIAPTATRRPELIPSALCFSLSGAPAALRELAARSWELTALARAYERFLQVFEPLQLNLAAGMALSPQEAILVRVLLIHEYRRIALRDPMLPTALLPANWPGETALACCAAIYAALLPASEQWLDENARGVDFAPLPATPNVFKRFQAG